MLHVGCGYQTKAGIKGFDHTDWTEIRFDIDAAVRPDVIGTLTDMSRIADGSIDAIYSSHNIEHLYPHEVPVALEEFKRVLRPDGFVVITAPDIQTVCEAVVNDRLLEPLYTSPAGPIAPIDILYGHRPDLERGNLHMAHKCGFTYKVLGGVFAAAGFNHIFGGRRPEAFDLWLVASKSPRSGDEMQALAETFLP